MGNNVQDSINKAIDVIVGKRINALALDKTVIGIIDSVVSAEDRVYRVAYDGGFFDAVANNNEIYPKGMSVYVQIPQNDMSKKKTIIGRASVMRDDLQADIVVSSLHDYTIIGKNIVSPEKESIGEGIRSYHEENKDEDISHRAKILYRPKDSNAHYTIDKENFNLYKENAEAIMIEADFRTSLDATQQYTESGVYGIKLDVSFDNANYQYGSTQGEIFDHFASTVKAEIDETEEEISMAAIDKDIKTEIEKKNTDETKKNFGDWIETDGFLDEKIAYIKSLLSAYSIAAPAKYAGEVEKIMSAYLNLFLDIKNSATSLTDIQDLYFTWRNKEVEKPTKEVLYTFNSNTMTGNPFSFISWSTQYTIFKIDFDNLKSINSIVFYKEGFVQDEDMCQHGIDGNNDGKIKGKEDLPKEDIFIRNLKIYALQPITAINEDYRLEIQSPDGLIFEKNDADDKELSIEGKITKQYYEDVSDNAIYYWFKRNPNVVTTGNKLYNSYGGLGWEYIGGSEKKGNSKQLVVLKKDTVTYKNLYKCVALVEETILLSYEFTFFNKAYNQDVEIISDIGQNFSFDAGIPLLTCRLKTSQKYEEKIKEDDNDYKYTWNIIIGNQSISFSPEALKENDSIQWDSKAKCYKKKDTETISILSAITKDNNIINLLQNVYFFYGDKQITLEKDIPTATRIKIPVSNFVSESTIKIICQVQKGTTGAFFGESTFLLQNQGHPRISSYRLILENGDQIFQYDEYGNPPNSPKLKSPQEIKPIIPHLLNPAGVEIASGNYEVAWTIPIENTMIISNSDLKKNPYDQDKISLSNDKQYAFKIAESYNEDSLNNQINCRVLINNEIIQTTTDFYFGKVGSNGTNGTDMVAKIVPRSEAKILDREPLTLYSWINDQGEKQIYFNTEQEITQLASSIWERTIFKAELYQKNEEIPEKKKESGEKNFTVKWNIAGNPQTTVNNFSKYIEFSKDSSSLLWNEDYNDKDTEEKKFLPVYIIRAQITYENKDYYAFYGFPVIWYNETPPKYNKIAINKATLLKEIIYNADGRNPIYNHNQGVEIINVPKGCTITWSVHGGKNNYMATAGFKLLKERNGKKEDAKLALKTTSNFIYILPNDEYNGSYTNNNVEAIIYSGDTEIATVVVPIHMSLNTFGLASLNAWDGNTVTIDEDNGYVMAPQVGAGEKDGNHRFTGILMGKTETYTGASKNATETGLFGYAHGLQSIFLDSNTGNAIFGLPDVQTTFDEDGNPIYNYAHSTIKPKNNGDDYNEGRVELIPGGVSKVGGWRLGRRSLYYIEDNTEVGQRYSDTVKPGSAESPKYISYGDYIPDKTGTIKYSEDSVYSKKHEKDIPHDKAGILIHSGNNPYISIKGRILHPKGEDAELLDDGSDSYLQDGDSLEIELDPQTPAVFSIFRHNGADRRKNGEKDPIYRKNSRTFLAGINGKGQLVANGLQSSSNNNNSITVNDSVTTFGIDKVGAFGKDLSATPYVGFKMFAGANAVAKLFVEDPAKFKENPLYLTGGTDINNEYQRPISIHGKNISLYASNVKSTNTITNTRIVLDNTKLEAGNLSTSYLKLYTAADPRDSQNNSINNKIRTVGTLDIETTTSMNERGHINLYAGSSNRSYLTLNRAGTATLQGWTSLSEQAHDGNINLYAQNSGKTESQLVLTNSGNNSKLESVGQFNLTTLGSHLNLNASADFVVKAGSNIGIYGGGTSWPDSNCGIFIPVGTVDAHAFFKVVRPLDITSTMSMDIQSGGAINIKTSGDKKNNVITITNTKYDPPVNGNTLSVSTKIGGFRIQKTDDTYKSNLLNMIITKKEGEKDVIDSERSLGVNATFGYFRDTIGPENATDGSKNNSVWAKGRYITNDYGAEGYAFANEDTIKKYDYSINGYNIQSLLEGILDALKTEVDGLNEAISALNKRLTKVELNYVSKESLKNTLLGYVTNDTYNTHTHKYSRVTQAVFSGTAVIDGKRGDASGTIYENNMTTSLKNTGYPAE